MSTWLRANPRRKPDRRRNEHDPAPTVDGRHSARWLRRDQSAARQVLRPRIQHGGVHQGDGGILELPHPVALPGDGGFGKWQEVQEVRCRNEPRSLPTGSWTMPVTA